ncbi:MAG: hypothetical protein ACHQAZ_00805 [Gammaproteobacteria bacterium]
MKAVKHPVLAAILLGGLIASTLDIGCAVLINGLGPAPILRGIASGLIGTAVHGSGLPGALLGLVLQWVMGILIATIYMAATTSMPKLRRRWQLSGALAGVVIYFIMSWLVVPLSAAPFRSQFTLHDMLGAFTPFGAFVENLLAMVLFGLIIAYFARNAAPARAAD